MTAVTGFGPAAAAVVVEEEGIPRSDGTREVSDES
jgi:hypothetical protein